MNWSKISPKGWIVIAILVLIPIGLVMKAFGYEQTPGHPKPISNPLGGNAPEDSLMPNLICMNLQDAQDEIQDHGVFFSGSVDASGKGRHQVIDSNWVVVGQSPSAGTPIGEGDAELSVVKYGETSQC